METSDELDTVVLKRDVDDHGLKEGDVGAVVHLYADRAALEVQFVTGEGRTVAVVTFSTSDVRPLGNRDILHAHELAA